MAFVWATLFIVFLFLVLSLNIFSLPANWIVLGLMVVWKLVHPETMGWGFMGVLALIAAVGEVVEFWGQAHGAKRYGASRRGNIGGIIGAIAGAIFGAPFLLGLGALLGALAGAYAGCLLGEMSQGRHGAEARRAALGAFFGKAFGMVAKGALGAAMIGMSIPRIWP